MNHRQIAIAAEAIKKYRGGEPVTDDELLAGVIVLTAAVDLLDRLGKPYLFVRNDLLNTLDGFQSAVASRKLWEKKIVVPRDVPLATKGIEP